MPSQPIVNILVDGVTPRWKEIVVEEPTGSASAKCTVTFAGVSTAVRADSTLFVEMGYGAGGVDVVFDSAQLESSLYSMEITKDGLTATWVSDIDKYRRRTPLATEYWEPRGGGIRDFCTYIARKVGYADGCVTNVPDIRLPAAVPIQPEDGYWNTLNTMIDPFHPLVLPDDRNGVLYIWWLDAAIPGTPFSVPVRKGESASIPKVRRQVVNVALLKYLAAPFDGGALPLECGVPGSSFLDPTGQIIGTTLAGCGVEVDPTADADVIERVSFQAVPAPEQGGDGISTIIERRDRLAVVYDDEGNLVGEPILAHRTETTYATDGVVALGPVQRTSTSFTFIRGTKYQHSAGHRSTTEARVELPLIGSQEWVGDLYEEAETIEYLVYASGDYLKYRSSKQTWGRVLMPENVPLYEAVNNRAVKTGADTYQWTLGKTPLTWEVEELSPAGGSVKYLRRRYNYLTQRYEGPGEEGDTAGQLPRTSDLADQTIEEIYPDQQFRNEAGGYDEPPEGWQIPPIIDGTWIGTGVLEIPGQDPMTARDWCVAMAEAMFRRSGKRTAEYDITVKKYLGKMHRGALITAGKRTGANAHRSVVTGVSHTASRTSDGAFLIKTRLRAQRLDPGDLVDD